MLTLHKYLFCFLFLLYCINCTYLVWVSVCVCVHSLVLISQCMRYVVCAQHDVQTIVWISSCISVAWKVTGKQENTFAHNNLHLQSMWTQEGGTAEVSTGWQRFLSDYMNNYAMYGNLPANERTQGFICKKWLYVHVKETEWLWTAGENKWTYVS